MRARSFATLWLVAAPVIALAQEGATFEAVSVKISAAGGKPNFGGGPGTTNPGQYHFNSARLDGLIMLAYDIQPFQVISKTALDHGRFDVVAKLPSGATRDQFRTMLQNLLAERFHLKVHHETRELPGWELVVAKSGLTIKESKAGDTGSPYQPAFDKDGFPNIPREPGVLAYYSIIDGFSVGCIAARRQTLSVLARQTFGQNPPMPIADHTALTGTYDFRLEFSVDPEADASGAKMPPKPDLFTAVREQLGLQFVPKKVPFDVVVVDSFDATPVGN